MGDSTSHPVCARCGSPTRPQLVQGLNAQVCVACGAVTIDGLEQLTGMTPAPVPMRSPPSSPSIPGIRSEPELGLGAIDSSSITREMAIDRSRRRVRLAWSIAAMGAIGVLLAAIPLGIAVFAVVRSYVATEAPPPTAVAVAPEPAPADAAPAPEPEPEPAPVVPAPEPVAAAPAPEVAPEPPKPTPEAPKETPEPSKPAAPKPTSTSSLVRDGWALASKDPQGGSEKFRQAVALAPKDAEANYGLGYCLAKLGNLQEAKPHLCTALAGGGADVVRDVKALLGRNGLSCP
jgi:hypothetical protein